MTQYQEDDNFTLSADAQLEPAPEGLQPAICVDLINLGKETDVYDGKETTAQKWALVWQVFPESGERDSNGAPFLIDIKVTASLNNSRLLLLLESWAGRTFTPQELKGFNVGAFVKGKPALLDIIHRVFNGTIYANIVDDITGPAQRKFSKVLPYSGAELQSELEHYDRDVIKRKYERMREKKAEKANAATVTASQTSGGIDNATSSPSDYVPF